MRPPLCYRRCAGAHALSGKWVRAEAPASALCPATAARQGSSVAASLVDSCEFRTADIAAKIRLYFNLYRIIKIKIHEPRYLRSFAFICG